MSAIAVGLRHMDLAGIVQHLYCFFDSTSAAINLKGFATIMHKD